MADLFMTRFNKVYDWYQDRRDASVGTSNTDEFENCQLVLGALDGILTGQHVAFGSANNVVALDSKRTIE